tara:strand:+ start:1143 stop:2318 length:1176 start_codon:yes stop_codon:yes gene_type:complete
MPHQIPLAKNTSTGVYESLKIDTSGKLLVSDSQVNLNTDTLEAKLDTQINSSIRGINNTASIGDGSTNHTSVALGYDRSNGKGRAILVDADGHLQCDILSGGGGDATEATQLNMDTKLDAIKTAVELLDNAVNGSELQVDIVSSALPTGGATLAKQDEIKDKIVLPTTLGQKANSNCLATCRSTTTGAYDLSARTDIALASSSKKILCDSGGRLEVKISNQSETHNVKLEDLSSSINADNAGHSRSIAVGLRGYTTITDRTTGKFLLCDTAGQLKVSSATTTTGADWLSSASIANGAFSATHDVNNVSAVQIFGSSTTSVIGGLQIHGSNDDSNFFSLHNQIEQTNPLALIQNQVGADNHQFAYLKNPPRYLRIYNNSGGTATLTLKVSTQ